MVGGEDGTLGPNFAATRPLHTFILVALERLSMTSGGLRVSS